MSEIWAPSPERQGDTRIAEFMRACGVGHTGDRYDYDALWRHSIAEPEEFWRFAWEFLEILGSRGERIIQPGDEIFEYRFFPDARLNYAENLLRREGDENAIIFEGEDGTIRSLSCNELRRAVSMLQSSMREDGIGKGDKVAGIVANVPEAIVAMLATASLGAVWSSCSPDFGLNGIIDRFSQIEPLLLFSMDGYHYGGKWHGTAGVANEVARRLPGLRRHVTIAYGGGERGDMDRSQPVGFNAYLDRSAAAVPDYVMTGFSDPLFILYSSGTTGLPKCIVHSAGGTLLQHAKEHQLNCDIRHRDRLCYFTTTGWMMWNWMVSALGSGAAVMLYDGMPMHPEPDRLPEMVETHAISHFGASAKYFDTCAKQGVCPAVNRDLAALRTVFSTGSPLAPATFDYIYRCWKQDLCLSSIAGGTDILGCFVGGSPVSPVHRGQCQKRILGMDVRVYDEEGMPVRGKPGELVCASPHPSIPLGFYNDEGGKRFRSAYFERYPGVWHHGDWVELTEEDGMIFHGRSDATLNPSGIRIGTSEIYRPVEQIPEVLEALVVVREVDDDVEMVLFVRLTDGLDLDDGLTDRIRMAIRESTSPRHVPRWVIAIPDIPRTRSGKIVELAVRDVINGRDVRNIHALANPGALEHFRNLPGFET